MSDQSMADIINRDFEPVREGGFFQSTLTTLKNFVATHSALVLGLMVVMVIVIIVLAVSLSSSGDSSAEEFMPNATARFQESEIFGRLEPLEGGRSGSHFAQAVEENDEQARAIRAALEGAPLSCATDRVAPTDAYAWMHSEIQKTESMTPGRFQNTDNALTAAMFGK